MSLGCGLTSDLADAKNRSSLVAQLLKLGGLVTGYWEPWAFLTFFGKDASFKKWGELQFLGTLDSRDVMLIG